ncbi:uncharacterized protein LOC130901360 [Diorhabda carinulata]|uniref:uncharacterized protein LOC130901360 n=1 Tax=Diorhabda carinulata TaxID=1163345 RepID=UPI0025A0058C|nr:uncharacterized protein LOC130901360 [Diorhabda carinulata]
MKCLYYQHSTIVWLGILTFISTCENVSEMHHRTKGATEKQHDLWCYRCDTMLDGERCLDVEGNNNSYLHHKCTREQKKCQVRRISMSTSTDEITGEPKLWLLQRNCTESCEPGCIIIGERTKLHSCITCCDEYNYCNAGGGASPNRHISCAVLVTSFAILRIVFGLMRCNTTFCR